MFTTILMLLISSDPDLMRGDGIYSRYFSPSVGGPGVYTFEVTATDNGNTAYSWQHETKQISQKLQLGKYLTFQVHTAIDIGTNK